jgi:hypothetical protein
MTDLLLELEVISTLKEEAANSFETLVMLSFRESLMPIRLHKDRDHSGNFILVSHSVTDFIIIQ